MPWNNILVLKRTNCFHFRNSGQDGGIGRYASPPPTTKKKDNNQFQNKKQPELPENQIMWKSDNQGVKEETFIQTSRRGRDRQLR